MTDETIFSAALEKAGPAERAAYLDDVCAGNAEQRQRLEALLAAHARAARFLERPAVALRDPDDTGMIGAEGAVPTEEEEALAFLAPARRPDSLGRLGHYEVLEVLGKGGFGTVFRAFDETLQRVVAIKVLSPQFAATSPARKRFLREARSSAKVRHENVVQIYAIEEQPLPHLVMEFIPGETLQQRLDRTGPMETSEVVRIGREIAEGLAAAHATGLVHRDIKPGNILIEAGPNQHVKLTDFGLARAADDASLTQSGTIAGTPMFMAPEQAHGDTLDHRADLFSLGSVLYTMASGRPPFRALNTLAVLKRVAEDTPRPIREIIPEVPQWLCDLIAKLHAKKPADRIGTAREVADLLGRGLSEDDKVTRGQGDKVTEDKTGVPSPGTLSPDQLVTWSASRWVAAAVVFLALLGGLGVTEATGVTNVRGTIVRLISPEGTLVVEVDDPGVSVQIDGSEVVITGAGAKEIRLKPGSYTVKGIKDGKVVTQELVNVTKAGKQVVRVSLEQKPGPVEGTPEEKVARQTTDPDRSAAEYVLSLGGAVKVNDQVQEIRVADKLPGELFRLTYARLGGTQVTDAGLAHFQDCKNLTTLFLGSARVTDAGLAHFQGCEKLTELILMENKQLTDAGLAHFQRCKNLTTLNLRHNKQLTDAGLAHFQGCKNLTHLQLMDTAVADTGLAYLKGCKKLKLVNLHRTKVMGAGLAHLAACEDLRVLWLEGTQVDDAGLAHLKGCKKLEQLGLDGTQVTDAGLPHLAELDALPTLTMLRTKVTREGAERLGKALPRCRIVYDGGTVGPR